MAACHRADWLHKAIFPREAKLTPEAVYWYAKLAYAEYLAGGITSCFDMYFFRELTARAAIETGFRHVFCGAANDFGGFDELEGYYNLLNSMDPLVSFIFGFHAEYTTSEDNLKRMADIAHKYEAPVFTHISESYPEVEGCRERYGVTPAVLFDRLGIFDYGGGGFHCVWFTDEDRDIFKKRGLWSVFNALFLWTFAVVLCHNTLGYILGYTAGRLARFNTAKKRTISIEVGMQNAGLATVLAGTFFAAQPLSVLPCAISCAWHSISGTILAGLFLRHDRNNE